MKSIEIHGGAIRVTVFEPGEKCAGKVSVNFGGRVDASGRMIEDFYFLLDALDEEALRRALAISAATELLEALKSAQTWLRQIQIVGPVATQIDVAIAKAEPTPDTFTDADRMHDQAADVAAETEEFES